MTDTETLLGAIATYLRDDVQGELSGFGAYQNRIAINLLGVLEREARLAEARQVLDDRLASELGLESQGLAVRLARGLRDGELQLGGAALDILRQQALLALAVDNPRYSGYRQARERWADLAAATDAAAKGSNATGEA